ncbi:sporulation integral membrane protein YtvI [Fictibacillus sp. KIGAM418]|uniref:Sporulation integral membrane protein YtvI n=1 Tax=Fictibacillus marinisediminis TaxID=2878389 RepID=A0A9X1X8M5_9BACL|nr:sporulation integral membrane protein YtvI [Fictibacillus marinisediminis]MCK6255964.1 sporulation integral membrane protein YtvI [Fictibacillus marinisediminis]
MSLKNLIIIGLVLAVVIFLIPYSIPLILALVTALVLEPAIKLFIKNFKMKRLLSVTVVFILFLAGFGLLSYWLTTTLVVQTIEFLSLVPSYAVKVFGLIEKDLYKAEKLYASLPPEVISTIQNALKGFKTFAGSFASKLTNGIIAVIASIPQLLIYLIIYLVAVFLISLDLPRLFANFLNLFTTSAREKVELVFTQLSRATVGFIRAQIILSFITYVLALIGLLILDVKYAVLIALFIVLVDILPILGTGSFIVPWAVYNFVVSNDFLAIGLMIMFAVLTVIRRIIEPKILGSSLGISALAALISLYLGFQLLGFVGLIVGPALVIIYEALRSAGFVKIKIDF